MTTRRLLEGGFHEGLATSAGRRGMISIRPYRTTRNTNREETVALAAKFATISDVDRLTGGGAVDFLVSLEDSARAIPNQGCVAQRGSPATPRRVEEAAGLNNVMVQSMRGDTSRNVFFRAACRITRVAGLLRSPRRSFHVS